MDEATKYTDKKISKLIKEIESVYTEAAKDMEAKLNEFDNKYKIKLQKHEADVKKGIWTQEQLDSWKKGQAFQGQQWKAKQAYLLDTVHNANKIAVQMINGNMSDVFTFNANYEAYSLEHNVGINFGFSLYDSTTVAQLIKNNPQTLPEWKIDQPKDYIWNQKKLNSAVTQGIIQGESLDKITNRISQKLSSSNENLMKTFARTAMTGAQNSGRSTRLSEAKKIGLNVVKEWMSTLDDRTRDSHRAIDGEKISVGDKWHPTKFSNGCRFPGDPQGPAHEVYNCRCTLVGDLVDYPAEYERYDNIEGKPIKNMTYIEWAQAKKKDKQIVVDSFQSLLGRAKTIQEVNDLMNDQGWWHVTTNFIPLDFGVNTWDEVKVVNYDEWKRLMPKADLTGVDLDSAKAIAASYEQIFERFPKLKGKFDPPDAHPRGMKDNTYAWCYSKMGGKVQVNPNRYNDWQKIVQSYNNDVVKNWHPYGTTAESIVVHELGHAIDGLLAQEGILGGVTASGQYKYASSTLKSTIMNRVAKKDLEIDKLWNAKNWKGEVDEYWRSQAVAKNVSRYATKNNQEWFAECFAEYITSAQPRSVAAEFGKELEKLIERIK